MRTKTKGTKITAIFIVLTMLMSISTGIMANEPELDYVVTYQAEEITDTDTLIEMALGQPKSNARSATVTDDQLEVKQLLETREYKDGSMQNDYVQTGIVAVDVNGLAINIKNQSHTGTASGYGVFLTVTTYYTVYEASDIVDYPNDYYIIISRVAANVSHNGGAVQPSYLYFYLWHNSSANGRIYCNPGSTQNYTFNTDNNRYYGREPVLRIQTTLYLSNGSNILADNVIYNR